ncbi:DNA internalization-related competence protein ComEC/Rec2 [Brevibacillus reuszeri]|nr:DNA internalization-related competence protein ComEC/Rec2 [Brevibacillus reuszeri]KNB74186.1 competence protein ComEC [Brevibacillus reuszeri]MED1859795.1 DNA internalization-related competence protein ComEC/Rec2 [Brevibacillus reuszeri]
MLGASILMMAGYLLSAYLHPAWLLAAAGLSAALAVVIPQALRKQCVFYALILILAGLYFNGYEFLHRSEMKQLAETEETIRIRAMIASPVKRDGDVARFFVDVQQIEDRYGVEQRLQHTERIVLRVKLATFEQAGLIEKWRSGSVVTAKIKLSLPSPARNPHAFDYAQYLYWQGVHVTGEAEFKGMEHQTQNTIMARFQEWQGDGANRIERLFPDPEVAGYMKSLLLGLGQEVTPELSDMYSFLGLSHILAISGLHVTLVSSMFMWTLERTGIRRKTALITTICMLIGYVLLVGASASAVRSGIMGGVGLACQILGKRLDGREVWAGALLVMLLFNPYQLWHIGFQLSFAVTLGLIIYVPFSLQMWSWGPVWLRSLIAVTLVAQVVSFPFLIYHFHQFSPLSWLVNLLVTPLLSIIVLPLGYIAIILGMVHPALAMWPVKLSSLILDGVHQPLFGLQKLEIPFTYWQHPPWWLLFLYTIFLIVIPFLWKRGFHRRRDTILYIAIFFALLLAARQPFSGEKEVRITFLDVGQGDSIVVEIANQKVYLIDAGGTISFAAREPWREKRNPFEVGKDVVLPFLMARGIEKIDRVVMTHGDMDHIGGLAALVPRFAIGEVIVNGSTPKGYEQEILQLVREKRVPIVTGSPGQTWSDAPGIEWKWLHPGQTSAYTGNDSSVVLQLTAYETIVLFTGDVERNGEFRLVKGGLPPVDVLKVAHHGSKTSSTEALLSAIQPKAAVISAGANNRYGHPSPEVLTRLKNAGSSVYRTDQQGAVTLIITTSGMSWKTQLTDT